MADRNLFRLDMLVLSILSKHDCYGYQLTQIMKRCSDNAVDTRVSSLYPILYRMIDDGYITDYERIIKKKRKRVYYHLEEKGKEQLELMLANYAKLVNGIQCILDYDGLSDQ